MGPHCRRCRGEEGVFLVMWALLIVAIFTMVAIVIDLGALRADRRKDRAAADAAATAGANDIPLGSAVACATAVAYAENNLGFPPASFTPTSSNCASWGTCDPAVDRSVTYTSSRYEVTVTNPVRDGDTALLDADAVGGDIPQTANATLDGAACDRVGVAVKLTRDTIFGRVVKLNQNNTTVHSVARHAQDDGGLHPNLVVLEPHGCGAVKVSGTPSIEIVGNAALRGGVVIVDDGASCTSPGWVLDVGSGNDNSHLTAVNGDIYLKAGSGACTDRACDPSQLDLATCYAASSCTGYYPAPQAITEVVNRSRIDYLWNCRTGYTNGTGNYTNVVIDGITMADCPDAATKDDYLNKLYKQVTATGSGMHLGAYDLVINPPPPPPPKKVDCPDPLPPLPATGSVKFNCVVKDGSSFTVNGDAWFAQTTKFVPGVVTVAGNAVFDGPLDIKSTLRVNGNAFFAGKLDVSTSAGKLLVNGKPGAYPTSCDATNFATNIATCVLASGFTAPTTTPSATSAGGSFAFLMGGLSQSTGGEVTFDRVMVYAGPSSKLERNGGDLTWLPPTTGPFKKLSLWSDSTSDQKFAGSDALTVDGVFFAPEATFVLGGSSSIVPQDAQFWARKLEGTGTSTFRMTPDPDTPTVDVGPSVRLIR